MKTAARWTKDTMIAKLETSPVFVERAMLAMFARQTTGEQASHTASVSNGVGYSGADADIMSSFVEWAAQMAANGRAEGSRLSVKQRELAVKKLRKYTRQLIEIAAERAAVC